MGKYYAVAKGREVGIFSSWSECEEQVKGYSGAIFKKFNTESDASNFISDNSIIIPNKTKTSNITIEVDKKSILNEYDKLLISESSKYVKDCDVSIDKNTAIAYVDGSYNHEFSAYSYGVVYFDNKGKRTINGRGKDSHLLKLKNVAGELKSSAIAMEIALKEGKKNLCIYYDFLGIENFATKEWQPKNEGGKIYQKYFKSVSQHINVSFVKVKSKSGNKHHDKADQLATWAMG